MIELLRAGLHQRISTETVANDLRRYAGDARAEEVMQLATAFEPYLRTVPDALAVALHMSKDPHCGRAVAFATGTILTYVLDEDDLVPASTFGSVGMLDDAYLAHAFAGALMRTYPFAAPPSATYTAPDVHVSRVVAALLPAGVAESLLRTCESTIQVAQALFPAGPGPGANGATVELEVRVAAAIAAHAVALPQEH